MRHYLRTWMPAVLLLASLLARPSACAADAPATPRGLRPAPAGAGEHEHGGFRRSSWLPDRAPLTVANFLRYVKEGFYSGTIIHRVIANFVIQGGGHEAGDYKLKPTHESIFNESGNGLQNKRGAVGLARGEPAHSGNSQFYVNLVDNPDLDPLPTRWGYCVFGHIVEGMDVVDRIGVTRDGCGRTVQVRRTADSPSSSRRSRWWTPARQRRRAPHQHRPQTPPATRRSCLRSSAIDRNDTAVRLGRASRYRHHRRPWSSSSVSSRRTPQAPKPSTSSVTCSRPGSATMTATPRRRGCRAACAH